MNVLKTITAKFVEKSKDILGNNLVGVYLHGSAVMGCFNEKTSDIDLLVVIHHDMTKQHYISFIAFVTSDRFQMVKLYPEGNPETRLQLRGRGVLYFYCNRHGLFKKKL